MKKILLTFIIISQNSTYSLEVTEKTPKEIFLGAIESIESGSLDKIDFEELGEISDLQRSMLVSLANSIPSSSRLINILLQKGLYYRYRNSSGYTLVHCVKQPGIVNKIMSKSDAKIYLNDTINATGDTPLNLALSLKQYAKCKTLLKQKPRPRVNIANIFGDLPLHTAIKNSIYDRQIIRSLRRPLKNTEFINWQNQDGETALSLAIYNDRFDIICPLLKSKNIDINSQYRDGNTLSHKCIMHGKLKALKLLLKHGADLDIRNSKGFTIYETTGRTLDSTYKRAIELESEKRALRLKHDYK